LAAAGTSNVRFRIKDTATGTPTLTAAGGGLVNATQVETLNATQLVFTSAPQTVQYTDCSLATAVQNQNGTGSAVNVAGATAVNLTSSSGTMRFYSNATCATQITSV